MKKISKTLKITVGLPGSGKTFWSEGQVGPYRYYGKNETVSIDFDRYTTNKIDKKRIEDEINSWLSQTSSKTVIVDGMFLTVKDVVNLLSLVKPEWLPHIEVVVEYWNSDVEKCLMNDKGRRNKNSEITIKNGVMDKSNTFVSGIEETYPTLKGKVKLNTHNVIVKPDWKVFGEEHGLHFDNTGIVKSSSWCMGGTWGNCWGNSGTVSPEPEPDGFPELDELLEKICPTITFLQYKGIYREIVSSDTSSDGDYYGGSTTHGFKYFNVEALYNALKSRDLI